MNATDKHPRWTGVMLSLFFPGAGQYFAGAKGRGVIWFVTLFLALGLAFWLLAEPAFSSLVAGFTGCGILAVLWLAMLWDARRPIAKMDWLNWGTIIVCGLGLLLLEKSFWSKWLAEDFPTPNNSMAPTFQAGRGPGGLSRPDRFVVQKWAYWFNEPRRGDILVFKVAGLSEAGHKGFFAYRLAALPGERISIVNGRLAINGLVVSEPAAFRSLQYVQPEDATLLNNPSASFVVPAGHYFVLGDNSSESYDSRYWGPVPRRHIVGRVTRICWPLARATTFP